MSLATAVEGRRCGNGFSKNVSFYLKHFKCAVNDVYVDLYTRDWSPVYGPPSARSVPIFVNRFCPTRRDCRFLAVANEAGILGIRDTDESTVSTPSSYRSEEAHQNAVFDIAWFNGGDRILTASGDHSVYMWDLNKDTITPHLSFMGHSRSVRTLACTPFDNAIFASGARDGVIYIWDSRKETTTQIIESDNYIAGCHLLLDEKRKRKPNIFNSGSVTGLVFQDSNKLISCSSSESVIKVWDIRKCYRNYKKVPQPVRTLSHSSVRGGFSSLALSPCGQYLFSCCSDQSIIRFNTLSESSEPDAVYKGVTVGSYFINVTVSPCGNYVMSGSSDERAVIWELKRPQNPVATLHGHSAEVSHTDWKPFGEPRLATCSDDGTYRIWRLLPDLEGGENLKSVVGGWVNYNECKDFPKKLKGVHGCVLNLQNKIPKIKEETTKEFYGLISPKAKRRKIELGTFSPTANLPSIVEDGTSPHQHICKHPVNHQVDWLTKLRQTTPPQIKPHSITSRRRSSTSKRSSKVNLLKFFKLSTKSLEEENAKKGSSQSDSTSS